MSKDRRLGRGLAALLGEPLPDTNPSGAVDLGVLGHRDSGGAEH